MTIRYLLITSKIEAVNGYTIDAFNVAMERLKQKKWALYASTSHKDKIKENDEIYIYIGKTNAKNLKYTSSIIASAKIAQVENFTKNSYWFESDKYLVDTPVKLLTLNNIKHFNKPFGFRENFKKISFISKIKSSSNNVYNWGAFMQGGIKVLNEKDVSLIMHLSK